MRPYNNIKLGFDNDISGIQSEGRKSIVGRLKKGEAGYDGKVCRNERGYCRPGPKAATRRYLKRVDRAIAASYLKAAEGE